MAEGLNPTRVSVVMAVYNGADYVRAAVDSILGQAFKNFEFIIIDDGSTDNTAKILKSYKDPRIKLISQTNQGLVASLNKGISAAKGHWIARQDADDISAPERLASQVAQLKADRSLVAIGSSIKTIGKSGKIKNEHRVLLNDAELKQELMVRSPFAHGSVIFSRQAFIRAGGYRQADWPAEDYGLWLRLSRHGDYANIDKSLYSYREHAEATSVQHLGKQNQQRDAIRERAWRRRQQLLADRINTAVYQDLVMGQFRLERIAKTQLFILSKALRNLRLRTAATIAWHLLADSRLRRKCARLVAIKLRLKRG